MLGRQDEPQAYLDKNHVLSARLQQVCVEGANDLEFGRHGLVQLTRPEQHISPSEHVSLTNDEVRVQRWLEFEDGVMVNLARVSVGRGGAIE